MENITDAMENITDGRQYYNHMEQRDIHNNNEYLQVNWSDVINEPTGIRSADFSWNLSYKIYTKSQNCCYKSLSYIFGPILALWFGLRFGCQSFMHIWCYQPCLRHLKINLALLQRINVLTLDATLVPLVKAWSYCFSNVHIHRYEKMRAEISPTHRKQERIIQIEPTETTYDDVRYNPKT